MQRLKIPLAVHELISQKTVHGDAKRNDRFFEETQVSSRFRATDDHYKKTQSYKQLNINRGHMAAAGNYYRSQLDKDNTVSRRLSTVYLCQHGTTERR